MNIVYVSSTDIIGQRFNGNYYLEGLNNQGHSAKQLVWNRESASEHVVEMYQTRFKRIGQKISSKIEDLISVRGMLHPSTFLLPRNATFKQADIIHYQLIQWPNFFGFPALPYLTSKKKSFLTLHDLWPLTGHCVSPYDCNRWQIGCGQCPYLKVDFEMRTDRTQFNFKLKEKIFQNSNLEIIVASELMKKRAHMSPMLKGKKIHKVPFGLDTKVYQPKDKKLSRKLLGVAENDFVIVLRASIDLVKGLDTIKRVLTQLGSEKNIHILTVNQKSKLDEFKDRFKVTDYGWVSDDKLMTTIFSASDVFLMPSVQETFGMMALEAMACGCPVVVFDGTALPEIVECSGAGIVLKQGDWQGMAEVLRKLREQPQLNKEMSIRGPLHVQKYYNIDGILEQLLKIYSNAVL